MTATFEFMHHASGAALTAILNSGWLALAAAAAMWIVLRLTPRMNAATRHVAWWAVLAIVVIGTCIPVAFRVAIVPAMLPQERPNFVSAASPPASAVRAEAPAAVAPTRLAGDRVRAGELQTGAADAHDIGGYRGPNGARSAVARGRRR